MGVPVCYSAKHESRKAIARCVFLVAAIGLSLGSVSPASCEEQTVFSEKPNAITFPEQEVKFVRFVIRTNSSGSQPCIDELEVYGPDGERNLALAKNGGKASAFSCLEGYPQHAIPHLNDGEYGNGFSWIAAGSGEEWAQIELPQAMKISKVVFSRDRTRQYVDRVPTNFEILLSMDGKEWRSVRKVVATAAVTIATGGSSGPEPILPVPPPPPKVSKEGRTVPVAAAADLKAPSRDDLGFANLALNAHAKAAASSVFADGKNPIHQIRHLNDGLGGNRHSWISKEEPSWGEIDLGDVYWIYKVAFGSDSSQQYQDRAATTFSILAATQYEKDTRAPTWATVYRQAGGLPVHVRTDFKFKPVQARWVRIAIDTANAGPVRIDELEVFGQKAPISQAKIGPISEPALASSSMDVEAQLRYAFLGEEHAWVKTYGRADLDSRLVPYNGRVKEYPRHVGDDCLPLPPVSSAPKMDGKLDDACWAEASRGVVRVASPYEFEKGPLAEHEVFAGRSRDDLVLAIRTPGFLSSHVAVVSSADWKGCGVVAYTKEGFVFNTYKVVDKAKKQVELEKTTSVEAAFDKGLTCCEMRLPLSLFPECAKRGLRVGVAMGGKHTSPLGRPVNLVFSSLSIAEQPSCVNGIFHVRLAVPKGAEGVKLSANTPEFEGGVTLAPGESSTIGIPAKRGPIGPEYDLEVSDKTGRSYSLHLFRYDPLERTLALMGEMIGRFATQGIDVGADREELAQFRAQQEKLLAAAPSPAAERKAFCDARLAKRRLFLREPDLAPMAKVLFVKRQAFHPSHIYTDYTDAPFRPGGGICILEVPRRDGRFEPGEANLTQIFDSKGGIARDPVATFDLGKIYFGYRPTAEGYYHIMVMNPDGSGLKQITDGPFHDFYPCPLPDGGIAFISTRCTARVFCFRGGASVLFRMDADGENIRPLSFASLSEWAP